MSQTSSGFYVLVSKLFCSRGLLVVCIMCEPLEDILYNFVWKGFFQLLFYFL